MRSFQILDENDNPIAINELDRQAAELWGNPINSKYYASPINERELEHLPLMERMQALRMNTNWFDRIGWIIANDNLSDWPAVLKSMMNGYPEYAHVIMTDNTLDGKYVDLIFHWFNKGYTPKSIA